MVRPGDIDVIGAMGDSLTAGCGALATNLFHIYIQNKGVAWSNGGQSDWRTFLTLPNILKEYNPNLYGYVTRDSLSTERASKFNVAEFGAMTEDMPHQARILVRRMETDPNVNIQEDWKVFENMKSKASFAPLATP